MRRTTGSNPLQHQQTSKTRLTIIRFCKIDSAFALASAAVHTVFSFYQSSALFGVLLTSYLMVSCFIQTGVSLDSVPRSALDYTETKDKTAGIKKQKYAISLAQKVHFPINNQHFHIRCFIPF